MNYAATLIVGYFLGIGSFYSANAMVIHMQSQKLASVSAAYEVKNIMLTECLNTPRGLMAKGKR